MTEVSKLVKTVKNPQYQSMQKIISNILSRALNYV